MTDPTRTVFLSYASQDSAWAEINLEADPRFRALTLPLIFDALGRTSDGHRADAGTGHIRLAGAGLT